jgi:hypothetical protein
LLERPISSRAFAALVLAGLILRGIGLPLRGTDDFDVWKLWTHAGTESVTTMYGVGGTPPQRAVLVWGNRRGTVEYPPAGLYALAAVGYLYRAYDPAYDDNARLNVAVKLAILLGDVGLCLAIASLLRRHSVAAARAAVLFYWLNPAALIDGAFLGYLDPWLGALTMAAVLALDRGAFAWCGVAVALALLTKLQIALVMPALAIALVHRAGRSWPRAATMAIAAAAVTSAALLLPFALIGALPNLVQGAGRAFHHDMLSAEALNVWWIFTWVLRGFEAPVRILGISRAVALGYPNPRLIGTALGLGAMAWGFWQARRGSLPIALASAAFAVHAYTVLSVQVHENHFYLALPLMAAAGTMVPRLRAPYALASALCFLNLFLFQGLGKDLPLPPRLFGGIDVTVPLSLLNVAALVWHARRFGRAASDERTSPAAVDLNGDAAHVRRGG